MFVRRLDNISQVKGRLVVSKLFMAFQSKLITDWPADDTLQSLIQALEWIFRVGNKFRATSISHKNSSSWTKINRKRAPVIYECLSVFTTKCDELLNTHQICLLKTRTFNEFPRIVKCSLSRCDQPGWHSGIIIFRMRSRGKTLSTTRACLPALQRF